MGKKGLESLRGGGDKEGRRCRGGEQETLSIPVMESSTSRERGVDGVINQWRDSSITRARRWRGH